MKFLLQHNLLSTEQLDIIKDATGHLPHEWIGVIPFSHEIISDEPLVGTNYIPYGSTSLTGVGYSLTQHHNFVAKVDNKVIRVTL